MDAHETPAVAEAQEEAAGAAAGPAPFAAAGAPAEAEELTASGNPLDGLSPELAAFLSALRTDVDELNRRLNHLTVVFHRATGLDPNLQ